MTTAVLVGNPKPRSRTYGAALAVAGRLVGRAPEQAADVVLDLADLGPRLLEPDDPDVAAALASVVGHDLLVVASPTYKASYTGLLKVFLDRLAPQALAGTTVVPLMLGGHWRHALAPELLLKPVLVELGATAPVRGLFLLDSDLDSADLHAWVEQARPALALTAPAAVALPVGAP